MSLTDEIFATLSAGDDVAGVEQFMALLRRIPGLRQWYRRVTRDSSARQKLDAYLNGKIVPAPHVSSGRRLLDWIAGAAGHARVDVEKLKHHRFAAPAHGGLSRGQVIALILKYQAGTLDCASFLVLRALRRDLAVEGKIGFTATNAAMHLLNAAVSRDDPKIMHQLKRASKFFEGRKFGAGEKSYFGYPAWWKLNILAYMLHHPKAAYRVREFRQSLLALNLDIAPSYIRRFCRRHEIVRDSRSGRPRKPTASFPAQASVSKNAETIFGLFQTSAISALLH